MDLFIWLDDERPMPVFNFNKDKELFHAINYNECIKIIKFGLKNKKEIIIDFDHDLGRRKTGYDIAKYIVENNIPIKGFRIHSMNPVGSKNIYELLTRYGYKCFNK